MFTEQKAIYVARTMQDAYVLKNLLAEERIPAVVINEVLEGGSSVGILGWPTSARVVVAEADAERARPIAIRFDRRLASTTSASATSPEAEPPGEMSESWPRCPQCETPRTTRCPVCQTAGADFRPADEVPLDVLGSETAGQAATSCSCGPEGCGPAGVVSPKEGEKEAARADQDEADQARRMLLCPTCDEPFTPEYRRVCQACGHPFADGYDPDVAEQGDGKLNSRILLTIVAILALVVAIVAYLVLLL